MSVTDNCSKCGEKIKKGDFILLDKAICKLCKDKVQA